MSNYQKAVTFVIAILILIICTSFVTGVLPLKNTKQPTSTQINYNKDLPVQAKPEIEVQSESKTNDTKIPESINTNAPAINNIKPAASTQPEK